MVIKIEENNFFGVKKENNKWYVIPINDNPTEHDYKIAEIEAKKLGLNLTEDLEIVFEIQLISKLVNGYNLNLSKEDIKRITKDLLSTPESETTFCANYERDNYNYEFVPNKEICQDKIVESVRQKLLDRSNIGIKKYSTTLSENNTDNYLNHIQMELMDACNYIEKLLQTNEDITQLVKQNPNSYSLGEIVRKKYGK